MLASSAMYNLKVILLEFLQPPRHLPFRLLEVGEPREASMDSTESELVANEVGSEVVDKGNYSQQPLPCDSISLLCFAQCPAGISNDMLLSLVIKLRENRSQSSIACVSVENEWSVVIWEG